MKDGTDACLSYFSVTVITYLIKRWRGKGKQARNKVILWQHARKVINVLVVLD